ncbi:MAG: AhpC/TSA family protein [Bergeyella sp.]|nr:AhpC/TSA family protein [Bergeyella sp.]
MKVLFSFPLVFCLFLFSNGTAQFSVSVHIEGKSSQEAFKEAYLYTISGTKDVLVSKITPVNGKIFFKYPKEYFGIQKLYFSYPNTVVNFISENKDVEIMLKVNGDKLQDINYLDESNFLMDKMQDIIRKKENVLPILLRVETFYKKSDNFYKVLEKEISALSSSFKMDTDKHPFISFFHTGYLKYVHQESSASLASDDIVNFLANSNEMLETSTLVRPILLNLLKVSNKSNNGNETVVNNLFSKVDIESSRGQMLLSELIDVFDAYGMASLKNKYLEQAKSLKCIIGDRLSRTLNSNKNVELGSTFENTNLENPVNTKAKTLYDIQANKKVVVFWASTCSHCEKYIPQFIPYYKRLKKMKTEIIGLSLDSDKESYLEKAKNFPWPNASELRGWNSSYSQKYNVHATPTYFILNSKNQIIAKPESFREVKPLLGLK